MTIFIQWLTALILAAPAGWLYRLGGSGKANTKARDVGVVLCMVVWMALNHKLIWIATVPAAILMFLAQTSYFKKKGEDAKWFNWVFVGLAFSISLIPYAIYTGHWVGFGVRLFIVTLFTTLWSEFQGNVQVEEPGRGAVQIITLPLLFVW